MVLKKHAARRNSQSAKIKSEMSNKDIGLAIIFAGLVLLVMVGLSILTIPESSQAFLWGLSRNRTLVLAVAVVLVGSFIVDN